MASSDVDLGPITISVRVEYMAPGAAAPLSVRTAIFNAFPKGSGVGAVWPNVYDSAGNPVPATIFPTLGVPTWVCVVRNTDPKGGPLVQSLAEFDPRTQTIIHFWANPAPVPPY